MAWEMKQVEAVLAAGGEQYMICERLERLAGGETELGSLLWELWRLGKLDAARKQRWWSPMSRASAVRAADLLALLKQAPLGQRSNLWPGWTDDLNYMLEGLDAPEELVAGWSTLPEPARGGLALAMFRRGWLEEAALGEDALEQAARSFAGGSILTQDHYRGLDERFGVARWRAAVCRHAAAPALHIHGILHLKSALPAATDAQLLAIAPKAWLHQDLTMLLAQLDERAAAILPAAEAEARALLTAADPSEALANLLACWLPAAMAEAGRTFPAELMPVFQKGASHGEGDEARGQRLAASARALEPALIEAVILALLKTHYPSDICWVLIGACRTPGVSEAAVAEVTSHRARGHLRDAEVQALTAWGAEGIPALTAGYRSRCPARLTFVRAAAAMHSAAAAPLLAEMARDTSREVIDAALEGLIALGPAGVGAVTELAASRKKADRLGAARVLAAHPDLPGAAATAAAMLKKEKVAAIRDQLAIFSGEGGGWRRRPEARLTALQEAAEAHREALNQLVSSARYSPTTDAWEQHRGLGLSLLAGLLTGARESYCGPSAAALWWAAAEAVGDQGPDALAPWLSSEFASQMARGHEAAFVGELLTRYGEDGLAPLAWALRPPPRRANSDWVEGGLAAVGAYGSERALTLLIEALDAKPPARGRAAAAALSAAGAPALPLLLPRLTGGSAGSRATVAGILGAIGDAAAAPALEAALVGERSSRVKEAIGGALFACRPHEARGGDDDGALDASLAAQPGVKLPRWLDQVADALPALSWRDGPRLSEAARAWVIHRMSKETPEHTDPDLPAVLARISSEGRTPLYDALVKQAADKGPRKQPRWLDFSRAWLLDEQRLEEMARGLDVLASSSPKQAEYGLLVLKRSGTPVGVRWLDHWSRKARRGSARDRARGMLDALARELGVSRAEVAERAIPSLGFDAAGRQPFPYGARAFTLVLTPGNEVALEAEEGRRLKSPPGPRKVDDDAVIKARKKALADLKKEIRVNTRAQVERLELAMSGRSWTTAAWRALFLEHPFIFPLGRTCLWETDAGRRFYVSEEKELLDSDYEPVAPGDRVSLAHPVTMSAAEQATWQAVFADGDLVQPFEQLARRTFPSPPEGEDPVRDLLITGQSANAVRLFHGLHKHAFERGATGDGGAMEDASRRFEGGWRVTLALDGLGVSAGWHTPDDEAVINDMTFHHQERKRPAPEVPERVYSEAMLALHLLLNL